MEGKSGWSRHSCLVLLWESGSGKDIFEVEAGFFEIGESG